MAQVQVIVAVSDGPPAFPSSLLSQGARFRRALQLIIRAEERLRYVFRVRRDYPQAAPFVCS